MNSAIATYPLISIVVPVYNASMYLERCFRCLREQSYPTLEFLLVDDGSTDQSGEIGVSKFSTSKMEERHWRENMVWNARRVNL